jgi:hypothetical protein
MGKSTINGPFSITTLVYQRVDMHRDQILHPCAELNWPHKVPAAQRSTCHRCFAPQDAPLMVQFGWFLCALNRFYETKPWSLYEIIWFAMFCHGLPGNHMAVCSCSRCKGHFKNPKSATKTSTSLHPISSEPAPEIYRMLGADCPTRESGHPGLPSTKNKPSIWSWSCFPHGAPCQGTSTSEAVLVNLRLVEAW